MKFDTNQVLVFKIRLLGKNILQKNGANESWHSAPDRTLEEYLLNLAQAKGAISTNLNQQIHRTISRNPENY